MPDHLPQKIKKGAVSVPEKLKAFDEGEYFAVLATQGLTIPYTSLVAFAITPDLRRLLFSTTKGTRKYKNILRSDQVALLIDNRWSGGKGIMETEAITVLGAAHTLRQGSSRNEAARVFLEKHSNFKEFIGAPSTALIAVEIQECIHVSRFQVVSTWKPVFNT